MPRYHGFTLIEMTMVLVVMSLLLGGLMAPLSTQLENNQRRETKQHLEKIKEALFGHVLIKGYFPCPDTNHDGREERMASGCSGSAVVGEQSGQVWHGTLPWLTLGVGKHDAWYSRFTYAVSDEFTDMSQAPYPAFSWQAEGGIKVVNGIDRTPAVVLSHGVNTYGGIGLQGVSRPVASSRAELDNSDANGRFELAPYYKDSERGFDDQMTWISPYVLKNRLFLAFRLKR